jgi:hypothetical protein
MFHPRKNIILVKSLVNKIVRKIVHLQQSLEPFSNLHACSVLTLELRRRNAMRSEVMTPQIHKTLNVRRKQAEVSLYVLYHKTVTCCNH